jgi:hypothetical protein
LRRRRGTFSWEEGRGLSHIVARSTFAQKFAELFGSLPVFGRTPFSADNFMV